MHHISCSAMWADMVLLPYIKGYSQVPLCFSVAIWMLCLCRRATLSRIVRSGRALHIVADTMAIWLLWPDWLNVSIIRRSSVDVLCCSFSQPRKQARGLRLWWSICAATPNCYPIMP